MVACKLPNGIVLQNCVMEDVNEPVMGGGFKIIKQARRLPETHVLAGARVPAGRIAAGDAPLLIGGYAITTGIPKDFWERWVAANGDSDIVQGGFVFAFEREADLRARAKDGADLETGLEPIRPTQVDKEGRIIGKVDPRMGRAVTGSTAQG